MEVYRKQYEALKGMRTLEWIPSLGVVKLDLELANGTQSFSVSPTRATVIYHFENQGTDLPISIFSQVFYSILYFYGWWLKYNLRCIVSWKLDALRAKLGISGATLRRHLNFWSNQGILREHPADTFTIIESQEDSSGGPSNSHGVFGLYMATLFIIQCFFSFPSLLFSV